MITCLTHSKAWRHKLVISTARLTGRSRRSRWSAERANRVEPRTWWRPHWRQESIATPRTATMRMSITPMEQRVVWTDEHASSGGTNRRPKTRRTKCSTKWFTVATSHLQGVGRLSESRHSKGLARIEWLGWRSRARLGWCRTLPTAAGWRNDAVETLVVRATW